MPSHMTTSASAHDTPHAVPPVLTRAGHGDQPWTEGRIRALGVVTDLSTAAQVFGLGRALAYQLARDGKFPVPVLKVGNRYRVAVAAILAALHLPAAPATTEPAGPAPVGDLIVPPQSSVDHHDENRRSGPQRMRDAPTRGAP
ncbi:hypothetical protein [Virgisporangium aurantiacum]|uniref:Helix-turn-helix domain-containing protein n=1 Tax=Virgisporangium aurantiacum TaxID=175570 RepID=A0A8J3ZNA9_9ACTN|nr:hypothetical protein [Virgisporangium aurantiacum]GIJ64580.1 hypothetical protein Vau01_120960 [Virgisporangium aurantiacum]